MNEVLKALQEIATFLGKKIDSLRDRPQEVKVELNADQAWKDIVATLAKGIELRLDYATIAEPLARIEELLAQEKPDESPMHHQEMMNEVLIQTKLLSQILVKKEDTSEVKSLKTSIESVTKAINKIKLEIPETNFSPIVDVLKEVKSSLMSVEKSIKANSPKDFSILLEQLLTAIKGIKTYATVSISDNQIKALMGSQRPIVTSGGVMAAMNVTQTNVALTSSTVQYSYTFPSGTSCWTLKLRDPSIRLFYSYTTGTVPGSGDSSLYTTLSEGFFRAQDGLAWAGKTIYMTPADSGQVAEFEVFRL